MNNEVIGQLLSFLNDPTTGVNALIPALPLVAGETAPSAVRIIDELTDNRVARIDVDASLVKDGPVLLVMQGAPVEHAMFAEQSRPAAKVEIGLKWAKSASSTKDGIHEGRQIMRCAKRAIAVRFESPNVGRLAPFNQVQVDPPGPWRDLLPFTQSEDNLVIVCATISFPALDTWALGITS